jgi:hypothetical protein
MDELKILKYLCIAFMVFVVTAGGCTVHRDVLKYDAIKSGVNPMVISCASGIGEKELHICTLIAEKIKGEAK